jgi:hypothetical protein
VKVQDHPGDSRNRSRTSTHKPRHFNDPLDRYGNPHLAVSPAVDPADAGPETICESTAAT